MHYKGKTLFIYTVLHFFVDFTTIFLVSGILLSPIIGIPQRGEVIIIYNLIAFAGQLPMGMVSDTVNRKNIIAAIGCFLSCISYPISFISPWAALIFAALGNGAFHIGAGAHVLQMSMPKAGASGLFVSSGALGVWFAYKAGGTFLMWLCPIALFAASIYLVFSGKINNPPLCNKQISYSVPPPLVLLSLVCFTLTIVLRSLLGMVLSFPWKAEIYLSFLLVAATASGKALGGFLGDKFGNFKTAMISLSVSLAAFLFSFDFPPAGIVAVLCFNMTMPLTLTAIADISRKKYGFAFGLTTFALAVGFIPTVFGAGKLFGPGFLIISVLSSLVLMMLGYILYKKAKGQR